MIKVARVGVVPEPLRPGKAGPREVENAYAYYVRKTRDKPPVWKAYASQPVRDALLALFNGKCSYCETPVDAGRAGQVEHWRPKGRIVRDNGTEIKPGYFWAAARWDNLLLSCPACNGEKEELDLTTGERRLLGKLDRFPLDDEAKRAADEGGEAAETPLLLHPCNDDPDQHLEFFDAHEHRAVYRARLESKKGRISITVYGLNRERLVGRRAELLAKIVEKLETIRLCITKLDDPGSASTDQLLGRLLADLRSHLDPRAEYLALARAVIWPFLQDNGLPLS